MWHAMSMKEAVKQWESQNRQKISQAVEIKLTGICPALDKMDTIMLSFVSCEKLSLSSNCIERITNLSSLKHLKILSLGRNNIKSISGIEAVGETLEELWISYNQIEKLKGIGSMKKLRVLTMSNNHVREWVEFQRLAEVPCLKELVFIGNPLEERCTSEGIWRPEAVRRLPNLGKLDGLQCVEAEANLTDAQTELQKSSSKDGMTAEDGGNEKGKSKFVVDDEEEDGEDADDHDQEVNEDDHEKYENNEEHPDEEAPPSNNDVVEDGNVQNNKVEE